MGIIVAAISRPWQTADVFHVGDVVEKLREQRGWNQSQLGHAAKVNKGTVSDFENDPAKADGETIAKLAAALGYTVSALHALVPGAAPDPATDLSRHRTALPSRVTPGGKRAATPASARVQQRQEDVEVLANVLAHATDIVDIIQQRIGEQTRSAESRATVRSRRGRVADR